MKDFEKSTGLSLGETRSIQMQIVDAFERLPDSVATEIFRGYVKKINEIGPGDLAVEDALFKSGLALAYTEIYNGQNPDAIAVNGGWYVSNKYGWDRESFARIAIPLNRKGVFQTRDTLPGEIVALIQALFPTWVEHKFGVKHSETFFNFLHDPQPAFAPFDHYTEERNFVGKIMYFPAEIERPYFPYMVGMGFPPVRWYSSRDKNDSEKLVMWRMKHAGLCHEEALIELGSHEEAHMFIDPVVELVKNGNSHSWLTEGFAQYFGDTLASRKVNARDWPVKTAGFEVVVGKDGEGVNYSAAYILTTGLAAKLAGSINGVEEGMVEIVRRVTQEAALCVKGEKDKVRTPLELLYMIDPSLHNVNEREKLSNIMAILQDALLR